MTKKNGEVCGFSNFQTFTFAIAVDTNERAVRMIREPTREAYAFRNHAGHIGGSRADLTGSIQRQVEIVVEECADLIARHYGGWRRHLLSDLLLHAGEMVDVQEVVDNWLLDVEEAAGSTSSDAIADPKGATTNG